MKPVVAIDAGHGMANTSPRVFDSGAEFGPLQEANLTLTIALTMKFVFNEEGISNFLVRKNNVVSAPLRSRPTVAQVYGCTHYVCVHVNDMGSREAHGALALYRSPEDMAFGRVCLNAACSAFGFESRGLHREDESQHSHLRVFDFPGPVGYLELGNIQNAADMNFLQDRIRRIRFAEYLVPYFAGLED